MKNRTPEQLEAEIQKQMNSLHCSRKEALDIIAWDDDIDAGDKEKGAFTPEQKKLIRTLTKAEKDPTKKKTSLKRERKVDEDKKTLIEKLSEALKDCENVSVKNEAEISFTFNENEYTLKLTKHRKK